MKKSKSLSARTVNKYVEYIKQVVASLKDGETGEPIHKRTWDSSVMDLPMVNQKEQRRPSQTKHITNHGRTIEVRQQVERDTPRIITCLKTNAAYRDVDLHPDVAEFLQRYIGDKPGLLFATRNGTPHLPQQHRRSLANGTAQGDGIRRAGYGLARFPSFPQNVAAW